MNLTRTSGTSNGPAATVLSCLFLLILSTAGHGQGVPPVLRTPLTTNAVTGTPAAGKTAVFNADHSFHFQTVGSPAQVVNVEDFGAVHDGVTDDTAAIQSAINSITNTGGVIDWPPGLYRVNGAFNTPPGSPDRTNKCQLYLPTRDIQTQSIIPIWFRGTQKPTLNTVWTTNGIPAKSVNGAIIVSTNLASNPQYTIFGGGAPSTSPYTQTAVYARFENLDIRCEDDPSKTALNLSKVMQAGVIDCVVDTDTGGGAQSKSTRGGKGIVLPEINNWVINEIRNTDVRGYNVGYTLNEHSVIDDCRVWLCSIGWEFPGGTHAIWIGHTVTTGVHQGVIGGPAGGFVQRITWDSYAVEHSILTSNNISGDATWFNTVADFDDTNSVLRGVINFAGVKSGVGADDTFTINNTTNVTFFNLNSHAFTGFRVRPLLTNDLNANYLFTMTRSNGMDIANLGQYPQPFQHYTGIWLGPGSFDDTWQLATNFTLLSNGTNETTINAGQPEGGTALGSVLNFQVGHVTKGQGTFTNFNFNVPMNHGQYFLTNYISGRLYTNTYAAPIRVTPVLQLAWGTASGNVAMQMQIASYFTNSIGFATGGTFPANTGFFTPFFNPKIPIGFTFIFTNTSTGAGNSVTMFSSAVEVE